MTAVKNSLSSKQQIGLFGFGAFGRLLVKHLTPWFVFVIHDPALNDSASLEETAACAVVILAVPVSRIGEVVGSIARHLKQGALVIDVGSVKFLPAAMMKAGLPAHTQILCTHPLFGPQSAKGGLDGLKIVLCPVRFRHQRATVRFLRKLGLEVITASPEDHDRELAVAQGLTHLIAQVLMKMEPLPSRMTTRSFDLLMNAVNMVRDDADEVLHAIEHDNPFAAGVRERFFYLAHEMKLRFEAD